MKTSVPLSPLYEDSSLKNSELSSFMAGTETATRLLRVSEPRKKMPNTQTNNGVKKFTLRYYPATYYHTKKDCYVGYYVFDEKTGKMRRYKIRINHIAQQNRHKYAMTLCNEINALLAGGWSPEQPVNINKRYTLDYCLNYFVEKRFPDFKHHTVRSYKSYIGMFREYLNNKDLLACPLDAFTKRDALDYMDYMKARPKCSARTYNNSIIIYQAVFNWLVSQQFCTENVFAVVKKIPARAVGEKKRDVLNADELERLKDFLQANGHKEYLAACMLIYYCLLRPSDLVHLRFSSFDFETKEVIIKGDETKNGHTSRRVIPVELEKYLSALEWEKIATHEYVFGGASKNFFKPADKQLDSREFGRFWNKRVRPGCGFDFTKQFYSLKDSGITDMLAAGVSPAFVQGQADHSDLSITSVYAHTRTKAAYNELRNFVNVDKKKGTPN